MAGCVISSLFLKGPSSLKVLRELICDLINIYVLRDLCGRFGKYVFQIFGSRNRHLHSVERQGVFEGCVKGLPEVSSLQPMWVVGPV